MILKSFLVEKNLSIVDEYFVTLFYGENIGLKDEIKKIEEELKKRSKDSLKKAHTAHPHQT